MSKIDRTDIDAEIAASIKKFSAHAKSGQAGFIEMPEYVRHKAQLLSAHFLLPAGGRVVDMGCERGEISYMLAALNPRLEIVGVDIDAAAVEFAKKTYQLPNLSFVVADVSIPEFEDESLDGIINSNILHHTYSLGGYDPAAVAGLLEKQVRKLKPGGTMLVRDYVRPPEGEVVLLELPDVAGAGNEPRHMSDAELLIAFSQGARPMAAGAEGFFIEELPSMREETRLFRLDHKWALEFIHRKDYRANWQKELKEEYTFFTWGDYRREFMRLGMRMVFSAPYWNPWVVKNSFKGQFRIYDAAGEPMEYPSTNHFIVAQRVADKQSLVLEERRPSTAPVGDLQIMVVRDKTSGLLHEMVKRPGEHCDIVPWRKESEDRIVMYVRGGSPRPIVNAATRGNHNLDGKKWSGHLIEPIAMDTIDMGEEAEENRKAIFGFTRDYAGLRPKDEDTWFIGHTYYPAPDRIDEAIEPVFIEVVNPQKTLWPIAGDKNTRFTEAGTIIELDAADIILASQVGLLPEPRLEMYAFELLVRNGVALPAWIGEKMPRLPGQPPPAKSADDALRDLPATEFEEVKNAPTKLKAVKSVFVEEGKVGGATRGLSAHDVEFVVSDEGVENIALVAPLSRDWDNNLLVSLEPKIMPVPNRLGGDGAMLNVPSFILPKTVKNMTDARNWVAARFQVPPENVGSLGESYFTHTGVTPQRVYPFYVASARGATKGPGSQLVPVSLYKLVDRLYWQSGLERSQGAYHIRALARISMVWLSSDHSMAPERGYGARKYKEFTLSTQKTVIEAKDAASYTPPQRIIPPPAATAVETVQALAATPKQPEIRHAPEAPKAGISNKLTQSYTQAKDFIGKKISLKEAPSFAKLDQRLADMSTKDKKPEPPAPVPGRR